LKNKKLYLTKIVSEEFQFQGANSPKKVRNQLRWELHGYLGRDLSVV
jgi:hypothetical protein